VLVPKKRALNGDSPVADSYHAIELLGTEAAGDALETAWQANWDATSVAHAAVETARAERVAAERAAMACRTCQRCPGPNLCDEHYARLDAAHASLRVALEAHKQSVETFKAGVTVDGVRAVLL
jgi:hypothetical protein